jgi:myosin heavy subunit
MRYMAEVVGSESGVQEKILMSNPILEAFGNATTLRNDNSSRFGKWMEMVFDTNGRIKGARVHNYMLEKSRVTIQNEGERNFHIFYLLCKKAHEHPELGLRPDFRHWNYLSGSESIGDEDRNSQLMTALHTLEVSDERIMGVYRIVAAILHIGNLDIVQAEDASQIRYNQSFDFACSLLQVSADALSQSLCFKRLTTQKETILKTMTRDQALENAMNLSKSLYSTLFDFIVMTSNQEHFKAGGAKESPYIIGVLDMYGFEVFPFNSFEQFCINYANEKLHQHFVFCTFKREVETYQHEGIAFSSMQFIDNLQVLELIESPGLSLINLANDEVLLPRGSDENLLSRFNREFSTHPNFAKDFRSPTKFTVKHFAGEVAYDIRGFLAKNSDRISQDLVDLAKSSANPLFKDLLGNEALASKKPILQQFKAQLDIMMEAIRCTNSHFIRCIKPNPSKEPNQFVSPLVLEQLKFSGIFESAQVLQQGFTNQMSHKDFIYRYRCLAPKLPSDSDRANCQALVRSLSNPDFFQIGETTVFFRNEAYNNLEFKRNDCVSSLIVLTQKSFKRRIAIKLKQNLLKAKPEIVAALHSRSLSQVQTTLDKYDYLAFEIKEMRDLRTFRQLLQDQLKVEELLATLNLERPDLCKAEIQSALQLADSIHYDSPRVQYARQQLLKANHLSKGMNMLEARGEHDLSIEEIELLIRQAREFGLDDSDEHLCRLLHLRTQYYREQEITAELRYAMEHDGATSVEDDYSFVQTKQLTFKLAQVESMLPGRDRKLQELYGAGQVLLKVRTCLKLADWEALQQVMLNEVDRHPTLQDIPDIFVASQALLKHSSIGSIEQELQSAINSKNFSNLQMLLTTIDAQALPVSQSLVSQARVLLNKLSGVNSLLKEALKTKQIDQLTEIIQTCSELGISNADVLAAIQLRSQLMSIYKEAALALSLVDIARMHSITKTARELGLKSTAELNEIHHILFEMNDLAVKTLQLQRAEELKDEYLIVERKIALKDEKIKSTFFRSDWKAYPRLKDPKVWASSLFLSGGRHHTFYQYTRHLIHESISKVGSTKLNSLAVKCFKSILTVTGDRIAGAPNFEAFYLLKSAMKTPKIQEELYLQIMKQLTSNPDPTSRRKVWNLLALFVRTFPQGNLEEYLHAFIRKSYESSEVLLKLMYYSQVHYPTEVTQDFVDRSIK